MAGLSERSRKGTAEFIGATMTVGLGEAGYMMGIGSRRATEVAGVERKALFVVDIDVGRSYFMDTIASTMAAISSLLY
jgi:hypothetical protein